MADGTGRRQLASLLLASVLPVGCAGPPAAPEAIAFTGEALGTTYLLKLAGGPPSPELANRAHQATVGAFAAVDAAMTTWSPSEVTRFNDHRGTDPQPISRATADVVALALDIAERTGGAFDVTVGPLVEAWGFGARPASTPPDPSTLATVDDRIGFRKLRLDGGRPALAKDHPELEIDLSGVAKGYAVDRAAAAIEALGLADYMVELGGEVRARGSNPDGRPWALGVERPDAARGVVQRVIRLADAAMATSGDYRNYREVDGRRVSHLIDPRTGAPIDHRVASATVVDDRCAVADAVATAMMVLGEDEALAVADAEGWAVLLLVREGDRYVERTSAAFARVVAPAGRIQSAPDGVPDSEGAAQP